MDGRLNTNLSDFPIELVEKIAKLLETRLDTLRFRSVCTSFRSTAPAPPSPKFLSFKVPSPLEQTSTYQSDLQLTESIIYAIEPLGETKIPSNTTTWFIKVQQLDSGKLLLKEPLYNHSWRNKELSRRSQKLPEFINIVNYNVREITKVYGLDLVALNPNYKPPFGSKKPLHFKKVVVSRCFDEIEDEFAVMAIYTDADNDQVLGLWTYKDNEWTEDAWHPPGSFWDDIVLHNEIFYAVTSEGQLFTIYPTLSRVISSVQNLDMNNYLVTCDKDLFLIQADRHRKVTFRARLCILKFDEEKNEWVKAMDGFQDRVWFLGDDCSFSISSSELSRFPRSCVVLGTEDHRETDFGFPGQDYKIDYLRHCPSSLNDGRLCHLPDYLQIFWPPPAWARKDSGSNRSIRSSILNMLYRLFRGSQL